MNKVKTMRIVLEPSLYRELALDDPLAMIRARAAFYLGIGLETIRLHVRGGTYATRADEAVDLATWLGMTPEDVIVIKEYRDVESQDSSADRPRVDQAPSQPTGNDAYPPRDTGRR